MIGVMQRRLYLNYDSFQGSIDISAFNRLLQIPFQYRPCQNGIAVEDHHSFNI
jgi:hypothetical protein